MGAEREIKTQRERWAGKQEGAHTFQKNDIKEPLRTLPDPGTRGPGSPALSLHCSLNESPPKTSYGGQKNTPACAAPSCPAIRVWLPFTYMSFFSHRGFLFFPSVTTCSLLWHFARAAAIFAPSAPHPTPFSPISCHQLVRTFSLSFAFCLNDTFSGTCDNINPKEPSSQ